MFSWPQVGAREGKGRQTLILLHPFHALRGNKNALEIT